MRPTINATIKHLTSISLCIFIASFADLSRANNLDTLTTLVKSKNYSEALKVSDQLISNNPDDPSILFLRATVLEKTDNVAAARLIYERLIKEHPEMPEPFNNLAIIYAQNGKYGLAIETLESAFDGHESYAAAYNNLQSLFGKLASESYRKALGSESPTPELNLAVLDTVPEVNTQPDIPDIIVLAQNDSEESEEIDSVIDPEVTENSFDSRDTNNSSETEAVVEEIIKDEEQDSSIQVASANSEQASISVLSDLNQPNLDIENEIVRTTVLGWADAWSSQDLDSYLSFYSGEFLPRDDLSLGEWKEQRRGRLLWREFIIVELSDLNIDIQGDKAQVSFTQYYKSNVYEGTGKKLLKLKQVDGNWFITEEII